MAGARVGSADAIIAAAQDLIRTRGPDRLRLSAVAEAAGVSRQTLYRWFPTKDHLLGAISERERELFDRRLRAALAPHARPAQRLDVALRLLVTYLDESIGPDPIGVAPGFALGSMAANLPAQATSLAAVLGDALDEIPAVGDRAITRLEAADVLLRLACSHYLLPHPDPEALLEQVRGFAGLGRRPGRRSSGRRATPG